MDLIITGLPAGAPRLFFGVNADLARWIHREEKNAGSLVKRGLRDKGVNPEELYQILALRDPSDRRLASGRAIHTLWDFHPELGPYPTADILETLEDKRAFFSNYREHALLHQLMVYILGLYLYEHSRVLREALLKEIDPCFDRETTRRDRAEEEFLRRWLVAATAHDIGYVLESPTTDYNNRDTRLWGEVKNGLLDVLTHPLSKVKKIHELLHPDTEEFLSDIIKVHYQRLKGFDRLKDHDRIRGYDPLAERVGLGLANGGDGSAILERYYKFAQTHDGIRPRFRDHGVTSMIVCLAVFKTYHEVLDTFFQQRKILERRASKQLVRRLTEYTKKRSVAEETLVAACGAIALHNVDLSRWSGEGDETIADQGGKEVNGSSARGSGSAAEDDLDHEDLFRDQLAFRLTSIKEDRNIKPAPLAFFLRLCDGLQNWGRPRFRGRLPADREDEVLDEHISIKPSEDRPLDGPLTVILAGPPDQTHDLAQRVKEIEDSDLKYLAPQDVKAIISFQPRGRDAIQLCSIEGVAQELRAATGGSPPPPQTRDVLERERQLRTIISLRRQPIEEEALVKCPHTGRPACELRWQSVLTVAELDAAGQEYEPTSRVLAKLHELREFCDKVRVAVDLGRKKWSAHPPPQRANWAVWFGRLLQQTIETLLALAENLHKDVPPGAASPVLRREKSHERASGVHPLAVTSLALSDPKRRENCIFSLQVWLNEHAKREGKPQDGATRFMLALRHYSEMCLGDKSQQPSQEWVFGDAGTKVLTDLQEGSDEVACLLEPIAEARTNGTRKVLGEHFARFRPSHLENHFTKANRSLPHRASNGVKPKSQHE